MKENAHLRLLAEEPVAKALVKLGVPTMVGMMVSSLYNLVDAYFVGILGTTQQAAVAVVYPVSLVMLGVGLLFGSGAGSYLARLLGDGQQARADQCASSAVFAAVVTGVGLAGGMILGMEPLLRALGCTDTMLPYARDYAGLFLAGLSVNVCNITISNLVTAEGAPVYSMRAMLLGGAANIILDPLLILGLHMGVMGAALATLLARLISLTTYLCYLGRKKSCLHIAWKHVRMEGRLWGEIAKIGVPTLLYQFLCSAALTKTNTLAAVYGDPAVAALGIVSRISSLGIMTVMGFLKGYQTFVGFNYGAKNFRRVQAATRTVTVWTAVFSVLACVGALLFRVPLIQAFNESDPAVLDVGVRALIVNALTFTTVGFQVVYSTKFMGLGKAVEGGLISLGRQGIFFLPVIDAFAACWGLEGIILAQPAADLLSMALVCVLAVKNRREEAALLAKQNDTSPGPDPLEIVN